MRWKLVLPLYLALACAALSDFSIGAWTPTLLSRHFGWSGTQIGVWFGGCLISSGLAAAILAGVISDWARRNQGGSGSALLSLGNILLGLGCGPTLVALATEHLYGSEAAVGASIATVCAPAFVIGSLVLFNASRKPAPCRLTES